MSSKIKIGISAKFFSKAPVFYGTETNRHIQYLETSIATWVAKNGALPFMIPSESASLGMENLLDAKAFAEEMDALVLQGGVDVHPSLYSKDENPGLSGPFDLPRDHYEIALIEEFLRLRKPILGICRGLQLLNVHFGGDLFGDLESEGYAKHFHRELETNFYHEIEIEPHGQLSAIHEGRHRVVSIHHQAVRTLGQGLTIEARSTADGIVEAFSRVDDDHFIIAVQWHPEFHTQGNSEVMDADRIFQRLLRVAKNRRYYGDLNFKKKKSVEMPASTTLSLGVELELQIVDPKTFDLTPKARELLASNEIRTSKIKHEIFQSMVEVETDICKDANEVETDLRESCASLVRAAKETGVLVASMGTHPFARHADRVLTPHERYDFLVDSKQWIARRIAIFGLHCHVGVRSPQQAIQLYRFYLSVSPLLLALSASSPFYQSENTGLASVRSTFFESTPTGGHPPILTGWSEFEGLLAKLYQSKAITSHKDLWWDVRPSLNYGTLEIRICDMMPTISENATLVAWIHFLGHCHLLDPSNSIWPALSEWSYRENKWRALRFGLDLDFIFDESGNTIPGRQWIENALDAFESEVSVLGYAARFETLRHKMLAKTPFHRMTEHFKRNPDLSEIVRVNCQDFLGDVQVER